MCLLKDSQQWNTLRIRLKNHLLKSRRLLSDFKSQSVLHPDLIDAIDIPKLMAFSGDETFANNIKAIHELSTKIESIEEECKKGITSLQADTKEMIQLVRTPCNLKDVHRWLTRCSQGIQSCFHIRSAEVSRNLAYITRDIPRIPQNLA